MSKPRTRKLKPKQILQVKENFPTKPSDLENFIREANEVKFLTAQPGWGILERDFREYQRNILTRLPYFDPLRTEYKEAQVLCIAVDKLLAIVNDYQENRDSALKLLEKMQNPDVDITMDVDTET